MLRAVLPLLAMASAFADSTTSNSDPRVLLSLKSNQTKMRGSAAFMPEIESGSAQKELTFSRAKDENGVPKFAYVWSQDDLKGALEPIQMNAIHMDLKQIFGKEKDPMEDTLKDALSAVKEVEKQKNVLNTVSMEEDEVASDWKHYMKDLSVGKPTRHGYSDLVEYERRLNGEICEYLSSRQNPSLFSFPNQHTTSLMDVHPQLNVID
eukprot:jgi/Bigna1/74834/fgenesh1_pg.31_\